MPSQNTRRKVRLNEKVESRVRGDLYARFGGECLETYHCKKWQGAGCLAYTYNFQRRRLRSDASLHGGPESRGMLGYLPESGIPNHPQTAYLSRRAGVYSGRCKSDFA